ncbi:alpha/beta hydrolase [Dermatobacter hominis]|uniref:alpha/beta hydrolase n=1 Tax=Dermatobacter hominis TaxID=2884263 RepID=UPI001D0F7432|nr:alpha/beta hydrolase [Dermatobacter hominis]UDY34513.1 alpha/beta fold hydrolase [Dermatobacter hominis]
MSRRIATLASLVALVAIGTVACSSDRDSRDDDRDSSTVARPEPRRVAGGPDGCVGTLDGPATNAYAAVDGVAPDRLSLDVYRRPEATGCPAIVWVHGGGWRTGDKQGAGIDTKVDWAGSLGAALVSVNYRLVGPDPVAWPDFGLDVATALDWVLDHAGELGIDPSRIVLVGHSAGAHLVSIVATNPDLLGATGRSPRDVRCVVSLDTASYDMRTKMADTPTLVIPAFGDDPATLTEASPTTQVERVGADVPDVLIVERGTPARRELADEFASALEGVGSRTAIVDARGYSHADVNRRLGEDGETTITPPVTSFLQGCFA